MRIGVIIGSIVVGVILLIAVVVGIVHQDAQEILIGQSPSGNMSVYNTPGWHLMPFTKTTFYPRRASYEFKVNTRFNDGGTAFVVGSIQFEVPTDEKSIIDLHAKFGSAESLERQLVAKVVDKSIFMSGPLMSSRESYAEKKSMLVNTIEDQITHGIYQTRQHDVKIPDAITGVEKTVTTVEIVSDSNGTPKRQEEAILSAFGIKTFNFTISDIEYSDEIKTQIKNQQDITMQVQTSIATAKQAEQRALTVAKEGEADAAKAKWDQEVIKAKAVTEAQQRLEVATLNTKEAEQQKLAMLLKADGEAEYRRRIMASDGALQQKLDAYVQVQKAYADAIANYKGNWVPSTVMGANAQGANSNGAQALIDMLSAKTARELALDMSLPKEH